MSQQRNTSGRARGSNSRRAVLQTVGVGLSGAIAGCVNLDAGGSSESMEPPPFGPLETDWPVVGGDPANTGHRPSAPGPVDDPVIDWQVQPCSDGQPSVAVVDDILAVGGDESVYVYDLSAGERHFTVDVDGPAPIALDEETCYVRSSPDRLHAYDLADGTERWQIDADAPVIDPIVDDETVYLFDETGVVYALDVVDGTKRWTATVGDRLDGKRANDGQLATDGTSVVAMSRDSMMAFEADTGDQLWQVDLQCCRAPGPIIAEESVWTLRHGFRSWELTTGEPRWQYDPGSSDPRGLTVDGQSAYFGRRAIHAVDRETGERRWRAHDGVMSPTGRPVCGTDTLYVPTGPPPHFITAVDPNNGSVRWTERVGNNRSSLILAGDRLFAATTDGGLYSITEE